MTARTTASSPIASRTRWACTSIAVDTACSSGLVVVHLACASLRRGESSVALAGAINLNVLPETRPGPGPVRRPVAGRPLLTFDARANGYVRGEGGAVVVLKTLSQALRDGDPIHAVLRGSAINNDGQSNGMTAPNPEAQRAMLEAAYADAAVAPGDVQYVEAHGTATPLAIRSRRARSARCCARARRTLPCWWDRSRPTSVTWRPRRGSSGCRRWCCAIEHRIVPPSLHFEQANPAIALDELRLDVPVAARPWPAEAAALVGGVSSFGMGGTNSHVVVAEWPGPAAEVVALAAESREALRAEIERARAELGSAGGVGGRLAARAVHAVRARVQAGLARVRGAARAAVVARTPAELDRALAGTLAGAAARSACAGAGRGGGRLRVPGPRRAVARHGAGAAGARAGGPRDPRGLRSGRGARAEAGRCSTP